MIYPFNSILEQRRLSDATISLITDGSVFDPQGCGKIATEIYQFLNRRQCFRVVVYVSQSCNVASLHRSDVYSCYMRIYREGIKMLNKSQELESSTGRKQQVSAQQVKASLIFRICFS